MANTEDNDNGRHERFVKFVRSEIRDLIIKIKNVEQNIKNGKEVLAHNKILGVHQKMDHLYASVIAEDERSTENTSEESEETAEASS